MNGLAGQGIMSQDRDMIREVKQLIMSGVSPEQLMQQGVPAEVIEAAMMEIQAEAQNVNNGLAGADVRNIQ